MSLPTHYLEYGRHVARLHHRHRHLAYAPMSNTASHDNHEKINSWVSFDFHIWDAYEASLLHVSPLPLFDQRTSTVTDK